MYTDVNGDKYGYMTLSRTQLQSVQPTFDSKRSLNIHKDSHLFTRACFSSVVMKATITYADYCVIFTKSHTPEKMACTEGLHPSSQDIKISLTCTTTGRVQQLSVDMTDDTFQHFINTASYDSDTKGQMNVQILHEVFNVGVA